MPEYMLYSLMREYFVLLDQRRRPDYIGMQDDR
jgi:hypothetical protein